MAHGERGGKGLGAAEGYCVFNWLRKVGLKRQDSTFWGQSPKEPSLVSNRLRHVLAVVLTGEEKKALAGIPHP